MRYLWKVGGESGWWGDSTYLYGVIWGKYPIDKVFENWFRVAYLLMFVNDIIQIGNIFEIFKQTPYTQLKLLHY